MLQLRPAPKFMDSLFTSGIVLRDAGGTYIHTYFGFTRFPPLLASSVPAALA